MNIYALSSGRGPSGIAIVRISGSETLKICQNLTKSKDIKSNEVNYCKFYNPNNGNVIDDTTHTVFSGKQNIILNFTVPIGTDMQLGLSTNNSGLYRNSTGAIYPYNIGEIINISKNLYSLIIKQ